MKTRNQLTIAALYPLTALALTFLWATAALAQDPKLSELRIDQSGSDNDEYFELEGTPFSSLTGLTYLVIGDDSGGSSGVIEAAVDLTGESIPASGFFVAAEGTFSLATADLTTTLSFENSDNLTHLLVSGFTGAVGQDIDSDDDGVLDAPPPWTQIEDCVALIETVGSGEETYCATTIGPDGIFVPGQIFLCGGGWEVGAFSPVGLDDTPGNANACIDVATVRLNEIRADPDTDEFFELSGTPSDALDGLTYLVIGDGAAGSGVIEEVIDLTSSSIPGSGFFVAAEATFSLSAPDLTVDLNFEDADNVTHLVVSSFTGVDGQDLDTNDDGVLDLTPWSQVKDCVALLATVGSGDETYCTTSLGPNTGPVVPGHAFLCPDSWEIGALAPLGTDDTPGATNTCPGTPAEIFEIQGSGAVSPFDGILVTTSDNIVTALAADGFFQQTPDARDDSDGDTSNGIFVFTGGAPTVAVGDQVDVTALAEEFFESTQLTSSPQVSVDSSGNALPTSVVFDGSRPSTDSTVPSCAIEFECYEGMRISITGGSIGTGNQSFGGDALAEPYITAGSRAMRETGVELPGLGGSIPTWDGNPEVFELDPNRLGLQNLTLAGGSTFDAEGVLSFEFSDYELWPTSLTVTAATLPRPVRPRRSATEFTIGSLNIFRLFNDVDDPGSGDDGQVVTTIEYQRRLGKLSIYIRDVLDSPDVLGIQEVESLSVLQELAATINIDDATVVYTAELVEGNDIGGIDVGFLVRDTVQTILVTQLGAAERLTFDNSLLHDRPPLLLEAEFLNGAGNFPFAVLNNHNRSLSGIADANGRTRQKRLEQAQSIATKLQDFQTMNPMTPLVAVGDNNAFEFTDGYVDVVGQMAGDFVAAENLLSGPDLVTPDLTKQVLSLPESERYSFLFNGNAQVLDHALTTVFTDDFVSGFGYGRGNADAAIDLINQDATALRCSDHDGFVLYIQTEPEIFADGFESEDLLGWSNSVP